MKYLENWKYYTDLYDLFTIEDCLNWIEVFKGKLAKDKVSKKIIASVRPGFVGALGEISLYYKMGDRYKEREKTIKQWMDDDRLKQEKYDTALLSDSVFCPNCNWAMEPDGKTLHDFSSEPLRVLFFFRCPKCHKGRGIFEDGEEYKPRKHICPKCNKELETGQVRKGEVITTTDKCICGYKNIDVWDLKADEEEHKQKQARNEYLLNIYRNEFCLSKEEGEKYVSDRIQTELFLKHDEERKTKEADPRYQKAKNLKKLKVIELQKIIQDVTNANGFSQLNFNKPEIDRYVIISFSVQETKMERSDYDSSRDLRRALN